MNEEKLAELQVMLSKIDQDRLDEITYDLHFDWSDPSKLRTGQLDVLVKRLRNATRRSLATIERASYKNIAPIRKALANFQYHLENGPTDEQSG